MANLPLVSTIPAANLPPVSTTPVVNNGNNYQTADNLNKLKKNYLYANSTTQRCPNEIIKMFLIEDFSICHLELQIFPRIFEKIRNGPSNIIRGLGDTDS